MRTGLRTKGHIDGGTGDRRGGVWLMSTRLASKVAGLPTGPISWLPFNVKYVVSLPAAQVNLTGFDVGVLGSDSAVAVTTSVPGWAAL